MPDSAGPPVPLETSEEPRSRDWVSPARSRCRILNGQTDQTTLDPGSPTPFDPTIFPPTNVRLAQSAVAIDGAGQVWTTGNLISGGNPLSSALYVVNNGNTSFVSPTNGYLGYDAISATILSVDTVTRSAVRRIYPLPRSTTPAMCGWQTGATSITHCANCGGSQLTEINWHRCARSNTACQRFARYHAHARPKTVNHTQQLCPPRLHRLFKFAAPMRFGSKQYLTARVAFLLEGKPPSSFPPNFAFRRTRWIAVFDRQAAASPLNESYMRSNRQSAHLE